MWLYRTWLYEHILNTEWMIWTIVIIVFAFNLLAPIILYFSLAEKKPKFPFKKLWQKIVNSEQTTGSGS